MGLTTSIEWTDTTWNPIRGCSRVSEGCRNCYAEKFAYRFSGKGQPYEGLAHRVNGHAAWTGKVALAEKHLLDPLKWGPIPAIVRIDPDGVRAKLESPLRSRRIFVNSMSDLFHENVITDWIVDVFAVMALTPLHGYQVLTKRADNMQALLSDSKFIGRMADRIEKFRTDEPRRAVGPLPHLSGGERWYPLANVWLGVSIEDQATADERIPLLLQTPAAVRFISAEPLLADIGKIDLTGIDWVIVGGESGPGARPMHPDWARSLRDQCVAANVPFFFKQWGEWICPTQFGSGRFNPSVHGVIYADGRFVPDCDWAAEERSKITCRVGKKAAGALLDGVEWKQFPEVNVEKAS